MNKIIKHTTLLFLLLSCGMVHGQTGTLYKVPIGGRDNIVRYDPGTGNHIAYFLSAGNENHFVLTDMSTMIDVKIADGLIITDFEIIDDMVFFCGRNASWSGLLGWFNINALFYGGGTVRIDQSLHALGLKSLNNIEVYHNQSQGICIAGYGISGVLAPEDTLFRAFEAVGTPATGMSYRTCDLWSWGTWGNVTDMVVTDNLVVYLMPTRNQACPNYVGIGIVLQPFPKYNMFGAPPFYYHFFQLVAVSPLFSPSAVVLINNDPFNDIVNKNVHPKMVHSTGDEIAVCTHRKDLNDYAVTLDFVLHNPCVKLPSIASYITHQVYDLSALVPNTNNFIQMTSSVIAQLPNDSLSSIDGFLYDQPSKRYVILHRHEMATLGIMEHAVTTVDFISGGPPTFFESSYQSNLNTSTGWFPKSMCLDGSSDYTIMGNDISASSCFFWHNNFIASPGRCDYIVQYPVVPRPLVPEKYYDNPAQPTSWLPLQFNPSASLYVQDVLCEIKCNQ